MSRVSRLFSHQLSGLVLLILALGVVLTLFAGTHENRLTGQTVNNFLNLSTLMNVGKDASLFAIMAVGITVVIISGGIDLSVGSIYALASVGSAMALRGNASGDGGTVLAALALCLGIGLACGLANGVMVATLKVHPFIVTLGTMWVFRGIAFVTSQAQSIVVPTAWTDVIKATLGFSQGVFPVPMIVMILVAAAGAVFLGMMVTGRHVFALGGSEGASRYAGLPIDRIRVTVYTLSGLCAGIAAFVGTGYYGAASSADATGYELYVIASAVVGGASLAGGRGSAIGAMLGAVLIVLMRQGIRTLKLDQNYEWIIIGSAIVIAVVLDRLNAAWSERRLIARARTE
ncbi:MAG: ABC transporter permease [Fimbriimonadaceae bacterium]